MHKVVEGKLIKLAQLTVFSSHTDEHEPLDLDDADTNPTENHQDNGATPTVNTQPYPPHSPLEDVLVTSATPLPRPRVKAGNADLQGREGDLPDARLLGSDYMLYGVYHNWAHQNPGDQLDGGILEDSNWQARWEKLVCMPTQRYGAPSGKVRKIFVGILSVELDRVHARKWNAKRVIVFQSLILQRAQGVKNSAQIRKRILFQLNLWNCGDFDDIVKETYNSAIGYLGKYHDNQTM